MKIRLKKNINIKKNPRFWPLAPPLAPGVWSHKVKANYEWYQLSKYECFSNKWLNIWISQKNKIFEGGLDFDYQFYPEQGV